MRDVGLRLMAGLVLTLIVAVAGCTPVATPGARLPEAASSSQSPEDVIAAYWRAVATDDQAAMDALKSDYMLEQEEIFSKSRPAQTEPGQQVIDPDTIRVATTTPADALNLASRPERYADYFAVRNGSVTYTIVEGNEFEPAGESIKFITVVKATADSPWRVEEIGTGP
ncbi:MAG: DUF4829 domain-containing protein [Caldisericota bacterium]|nr:DUF4829 domain-containing protein [Caldisericota bacterium]